MINMLRITFVIVLAMISGINPVCAKERSIATTDDTAVFMPIVTDFDVNLYVEKVDGKKTKFGLYDSVVVDAGNHQLDIRLEYQPASGTSLILGGIANMLLRAGTNKTFRTTMEVDVVGGQAYQLIANAHDGILTIMLNNDTASAQVLRQDFKIKDGKFERVF